MFEKLERRFLPPNFWQMKLRNRPRYALRVLVAGTFAVVLCASIPSLRTREWIFGCLGVIAGIGYFLFQQHLNETKFFAELFQQFNRRYEEMNEDLQKLLDPKKEFADDDKLLVIKYFNLCAEEYLFYDAGYIDEDVWRAWRTGMDVYAGDSRFAEVWEKDGGGKSYYDFEFPKSDLRG